jgi:hypothetical protein
VDGALCKRSGERRLSRCPEFPVAFDEAHETDGVAVGVVDDRVPSTPKRVIGRLVTSVAGRDEIGVERIRALGKRPQIRSPCCRRRSICSSHCVTKSGLSNSTRIPFGNFKAT